MPTAKRQTKPVPTTQRRQRRFDADGLDMPTNLEIQEGTAWKRAHDAPRDEEAYAEAVFLYFRLYREQGSPCTSRCSACGVVLYGRTKAQGCGHCGHRPEEGEQANEH